MLHIKEGLASLCLFLIIPITSCLANDNFFPMPKDIQPQVQFWIDVFTKYNGRHYIIHDEDDLRLIYDVLYIKDSPTAARLQVQDAIHKIKTMLQSIINKNFYGLTAEEMTLLEKIPRPRSLYKLQQFRYSIRYQQGALEQFKKGIARSSLYLPSIRKVLRSYHLPLDLAYLPHVESAFDPKATSKIGAAGIWQFTHSTGKQFLKISYAVDERRDIELSTEAAAQLLTDNYRSLKSWPFSITAYNHGRAGVARLLDQLNTQNIVTLLQYKGGTFKFASRNFYPSFLAARYIATHVNYFFPGLEYPLPTHHKTIRITNDTLLSKLASDHSTIQLMEQLNPALSTSVIQGYRFIPQGTRLHIPVEKEKIILARLSGGFLSERELAQAPRTRLPPPSEIRGEIRSEIVSPFSPKLSQPVSPTILQDNIHEVSQLPINSQTVVERYGFEFLRPKPSAEKPGLSAMKTLPQETLARISQWGEIPMISLLKYNPSISENEDLKFGTTTWIPNLYVDKLHKKRANYYFRLASLYLSLNQLSSLKPVTLESSTTLEALSRGMAHIPVWLWLMFNPKLFTLPQLFKGEVVYQPVIELSSR